MIILIDSCFPYSGGDVFLRTELEHPAARREKTVIYPVMKKSGAAKGELPEGTELRDLPESLPLSAKLYGYLASIVDPMLWSDIADVCRRHFSAKRIAAAFFYAAKTNAYCRLIARDLKAVIPQNEPVLFYAYWMHIHACIAAKLKKRCKGSKLLTRCHGYDLYEERSGVGFLPGRKLIFSNADNILPVSQKGADYLFETYPYLNRAPVQVAYLGTCGHGLNPADEHCLRLVSCSNAVAVKRLDLLISALAQITDLPVEWVHYGTGELLEQLQQQARDTLPANIRARFEGFVENPGLMARYAREPVSFFVNVSESEGLPVSVMEAMSFGIPAIATDVGGTREIVTDGVNGYLIEKELTPAQLAAVIRTALTTDSAQLRRNARKTWEQRFNAEQNYAAFYDKAAALLRASRVESNCH